MVGISPDRLADLHAQYNYDALLTEGMQIGEQQDDCRWRFGDLGLIVSAAGELNQFAHDLRVQRSVMYDYVKVSRYYAHELRDAYPLLRWSHWREAARYPDVEDAMTALAEAHDADMTVAALRTHIRKTLGKPIPPKTLGTVDAVVRSVDGANVNLLLVCPADEAHALVSQLAQDVRYIVTVKERVSGGDDAIPF